MATKKIEFTLIASVDTDIGIREARHGLSDVLNRYSRRAGIVSARVIRRRAPKATIHLATANGIRRVG